mgnify:CR=1 FL=1
MKTSPPASPEGMFLQNSLLFQGLDGGAEGVHVLLSGGPAGAEAHGGVGGVHTLPVLVAEVLAELGQLRIGHDGILLVGGGVKEEGVAVLLENGVYLLGHDVGVAGDPEVQVIGEQSVELHAQQTALGQHAAPLLHHKAEVPLQRIVHNDHGFAEQSAHLVAADVEHIAQPRQLRQGQVAIVAGEAVAHPRTIDKEWQAALPAHLVQRRQLRLGVHGAALGGEGDIHHAGHDHVLIVGAEVMPIVIVLHLPGGDLAVVGGQGQHLVAGGLDAACGTLGAGVIHSGETQEQGGQAGGMSICTDQYRADERLILGFHVVPDCWLLQGGTTGGGGVMRWLEREFGAYEREEGKRQGKSSLDLFNEEAAAVAPGSDGVIFLPYMSGERTPIWDPNAKGVYYGLDFSKTKGHFIRAAMEGTAYALKHNLDVAEEAGAKVEVLRAMGGSANSLLWTQIKSDITGKPIVVPSSDTATTLGAVILAGVGIGMYKDFDEAVKLTIEEKRSHEPNNENRKVYDKNYETYIELYKQLKETMAKNHE